MTLLTALYERYALVRECLEGGVSILGLVRSVNVGYTYKLGDGVYTTEVNNLLTV